MRARGGGCGVGSLLCRCKGGGDTTLEAGPKPALLLNLMAALESVEQEDEKKKKEKESNKKRKREKLTRLLPGPASAPYGAAS